MQLPVRRNEMICPLTFGDPCADRDEECRESCALRMAVKRDGRIIGFSCAFAVNASGENLGSECAAVLDTLDADAL